MFADEKIQTSWSLQSQRRNGCLQGNTQPFPKLLCKGANWMTFKRHLLFSCSQGNGLTLLTWCIGTHNLYIVNIKGQVTFGLAFKNVKSLATFFLFCQQEEYWEEGQKKWALQHMPLNSLTGVSDATCSLKGKSSNMCRFPWALCLHWEKLSADPRCNYRGVMHLQRKTMKKSGLEIFWKILWKRVGWKNLFCQA